MITIGQIHDTAEANNIRVSCTWEQHTSGRETPKLLGVRLFFFEQRPDAWDFLVSDLTEVPVTISGTRQSTSSGATDNMLYPAYAALLPSINSKRATVGLDPIRN